MNREAGRVVSLAEWEEEGLMWRWRTERDAWGLGDWLLVGMEWDVGFRRSSALTRYSTTHLFNLRRTAAAFPPYVRSYTLSFTAHLYLLRVQDESERMALHARAVQERWTPDDVKAALAGATPTPRPGGIQRPRGDATVYQHRQVRCPQCQHVFPIRGHKVEP